ncbi:MAG: aldo/keto reductase [Kiritimatiellia bacterium]|nr:aldo/keto reductase [Kiritimatiellia bacterium]
MRVMQYRQLGRSNLKISVVGYGSWGISDPQNWGEQDRSAAIRSIRAAFECGINFFDTAEAYGDGLAENLLAEALGDVRDQVVLATKVSSANYVATKMMAACERSLSALKTDRIDLYQIHWPADDMTVDEVFGGLEKLKAQGKIRHYGVCNYGVKDLTACLKRKKTVVSNQVAYNALFRAIESDILPFCIKENIPVLCYSPLLHGLLTGKYAHPENVPDGLARTRHFSSARSRTRHGEPGAEKETFEALDAIRKMAGEIGESMTNVSLAWLLAQKGVGCVITGARSAIQAKRNARAGDLMLPSSVLSHLTQATRTLNEKLGNNPDLWQSASRIH